MTLYVLFAHLKETYTGQYAPDALAIISEEGMDENPEYMERELKKVREDDTYAAAAVVRVAITEGYEDVMRILYPAAIEGTLSRWRCGSTALHPRRPELPHYS